MLAVTGILIVAVISAGVYCWALAFLKLAHGLPLVAWSERRAVPWAMVDLGLVIAVSLVAAVVWQSLPGLPAGKDWSALTLVERRLQIGGIMIISLLTVAIGLPLISARTGATLRDFGWRWQEALADVRLGLIGFVMLAPPVYAIQAILISVWKPSVHPLIEGFRDTRDTSLFVLSLAAAVLVAPLVEELFFRVLLQGFVEKAVRFRGDVQELLFGRRWRAHQEGEPAEIPVLATDGAELSLAVAAEDVWPREPEGFAEQRELHGVFAWVPILISSVVFALLHWQHGPDWVPLTVLAAGMGYLYQRTHRLLPSLVVHTALNGASMWGLWVQVREGRF